MRQDEEIHVPWSKRVDLQVYPKPIQLTIVMYNFNAGCYLFEDDVDVTGNKLSYLLALSGLHRVVTILVVSKVLKAEQKQPQIKRLTHAEGFPIASPSGDLCCISLLLKEK